MAAMTSSPPVSSVPAGEHVPTADSRIVMTYVGWEGFETLLALRGDRSRPRFAYLDGAVELMSPSWNHELIKKNIAGVLEAYMLDLGITFQGVGEWLLKERPDEAGVEPDECYVFRRGEPDRPELAIEVVWTSGGLNKLEIYRRLGVAEVWFWIDGKISVHVLTEQGYELCERSACLPAVDLELVCRVIELPMQSEAVTELKAILAARR
jgi:Uma2 family endonuclease